MRPRTTPSTSCSVAKWRTPAAPIASYSCIASSISGRSRAPSPINPEFHIASSAVIFHVPKGTATEGMPELPVAHALRPAELVSRLCMKRRPSASAVTNGARLRRARTSASRRTMWPWSGQAARSRASFWRIENGSEPFHASSSVGLTYSISTRVPNQTYRSVDPSPPPPRTARARAPRVTPIASATGGRHQVRHRRRASRSARVDHSSRTLTPFAVLPESVTRPSVQWKRLGKVG